MLVSRNTAAFVNEIVSIKLINGEEVIGRLVEYSPPHLSLSQPKMLVLTFEEGQTAGTIVFVPYMFGIGNKETVSISLAGITTVHPAGKEAAEQYIKQTQDPDLTGIAASVLSR